MIVKYDKSLIVFKETLEYFFYEGYVKGQGWF